MMFRFRHAVSLLLTRSLSTTAQLKNNNILLMGSPGSGKTTVGRLLVGVLREDLVDVDDDVLEPAWGMSVAKKLTDVGGREFLQLEADTFLNFTCSDCVISLTGSQPMNDDAMKHARELGLLVYLDVHDDDILHRLEVMKVNRIVGQEAGHKMADILKYRQQFYNQHYQIRVICERGELAESVAKKVIAAIRHHKQHRGFVSTRDGSKTIKTFEDITLTGLAPDRGLYVSDGNIPRFTLGQWSRLMGLGYYNFATRVLEPWIPLHSIPRGHLKLMLKKTYNKDNFSHADIAPVVPFEKNQYIQELFHGPTASFKDMALQLLPTLFDYCANKAGIDRRYLLLVATSGDTGGAVLNGFTRHSNKTDIVVLFPENGVSSIQKTHMTHTRNTQRAMVIGLRDDFDACQTAVKDKLSDKHFLSYLDLEHGYLPSAANSINFARLLPQIVYHAWSYIQLVSQGRISMGDPVDLAVPTGNFGNILGAYYAKCMGIPYRKLVIASNSNNVLHEFFSSGVYDISKRKLLPTSSPAIDILKSSNLERYLYEASGRDHFLIKELFTGLDKSSMFDIKHCPGLMETTRRDFMTGWCEDKRSLSSIKAVFNRTDYMMDPHLAVAKTVVDSIQRDESVPIILSATAHYSKFSGEVLEALNIRPIPHRASTQMESAHKLTRNPSVHDQLYKDVSYPDRKHKQVIDSVDQLEDLIEGFVSTR